MRYDAIVIGAGPAGATTALLLCRAGWSVAVVEKAAFPRRKVCGEFMSATNAPLFAALGLSEAIATRSGPEVRRVGLFVRDATLAAAMPRAAASSSGWGRALGREILDQLLLDRAVAAGAVAWQPWRAIRLSREGEIQVCTIARQGEERELRAPIVVAAHGSWEKGSLPTQTTRAHRPHDLLGFKAHFRNGRLPADLMPLLAFPGGYGGMVNSDSGRLSLTCCIRRDQLEAARAQGGHERAADAVLDHVASSCRGVAAALEGATRDDAWLSAGPLDPGIRPHSADGVFRVGNVAGEAHPIVAEGISMAIQSGWLLAHRLAKGGEDAKAGHGLETVGRLYAADWARHFAPRIRAAAVFARLAMHPAGASLALPILRRVPTLLTFGAALSGKARPMPLSSR